MPRKAAVTPDIIELREAETILSNQGSIPKSYSYTILHASYSVLHASPSYKWHISPQRQRYTLATTTQQKSKTMK